MMEVLITMIIMSIGLLGVMALQSVGLRNNITAYTRSQATILAYDLADKARANTLGAASYHFLNKGSQPTSTASSCETTGCSNAEMGEYDVYNWLQVLTQILPDGRGTICLDSTPNDGTPDSFACDAAFGSPYVIKIWWDESRDGIANNYQRFYTEFKI